MIQPPTYDGHYVYIRFKMTDEEPREETWLNVAADLATYCFEKEIELVPRGVEIGDHPDGSFTARWKIRKMN